MAEGAAQAAWRQALFCLAYICTSAALINFNKYLLQRFPYAIVLTSLHMLGSWVLCLLLFMVRPELFTSIRRLEGRCVELLKYFLPLGSFFAVALFTSNQAYLYCSVAFLQFMKEINIVLVYILSCAVGLQQLDRVKGLIVLWILTGSFMCVHGELNFVLIGFVVQAISQLMECSKNVLAEVLMTGDALRMDPLTYTLFMAPAALAFLSLGFVATWDPAMLAGMRQWWHLLLPNVLLAFTLNLTIAMVLKHCSAMGFILAGLVKDIAIVAGSSVLFHEIITRSQCVGFTVTLSGIAAWSLLKLSPDGTFAMGLRKTLRMASDGDENVSLVQKTATA